jgi:hypothetical protein
VANTSTCAEGDGVIRQIRLPPSRCVASAGQESRT